MPSSPAQPMALLPDGACHAARGLARRQGQTIPKKCNFLHRRTNHRYSVQGKTISDVWLGAVVQGDIQGFTHSSKRAFLPALFVYVDSISLT